MNKTCYKCGQYIALWGFSEHVYLLVNGVDKVSNDLSI